MRASASVWASRAGAVFLAALVVYFATLAVRITVNQYDQYELLTNARAVAFADPSHYSWTRPPLLSTLLAPLFWLAPAGRATDFALRGANLFALGCYAAFLAVSYRLARRLVDPGWALVGAALLAVNPLLMIHAPSFKQDVPPALLATLAVLAYLAWRDDRRASRQVSVALLIGLASASRYNFPPPLFAFVTLVAARDAFVARTDLRGRALRWLGVLTLAGVIVLAVPQILFPLIGRSSVGGAMPRFLDDIRAGVAASNPGERGEPWWTYGPLLLASLSAPVACAALIGAGVALRGGGELRAHLGWAVLFCAFQSMIGAKEARYLFAAYPQIYLLAALGLRETVVALGARVGSTRARAVAVALLAVAVALPVGRAAAAQVARFRDPLFAGDYVREIATYAGGLARNGRVVWLGPPYTLRPTDYVFHPLDKYTHLFHVGSPSIVYFTGLRCDQRALVPFASTRPNGPVLLDFMGRVRLDDGDAVVVSAVPFMTTERVTPSIQPLLVERVNVASLSFAPGRGWAEARAPARVSVDDDGRWLNLRGLPDGSAIVYVADGRGALVDTRRVGVRGGAARLARERVTAHGDSARVAVAWFDAPRFFPQRSPSPGR